MNTTNILEQLNKMINSSNRDKEIVLDKLFSKNYPQTSEILCKNIIDGINAEDAQHSVNIGIVGSNVLQIIMLDRQFIVDSTFDVLSNFGITTADYRHEILNINGLNYSISHIYLQHALKNNQQLINAITKSLQKLIQHDSVENGNLVQVCIKNLKEKSANPAIITFLENLDQHFAIDACYDISNEKIQNSSASDRDFNIQDLFNMTHKLQKTADIMGVYKIKYQNHYLDVITVQYLGESGKSLVLIGNFTQSFLQHGDNSSYAILLEKINNIMDIMNFSPDSYNHRSLKNLLNSFPKDEFLSANVSKLTESLGNFIQNPFDNGVFLYHRVLGEFLHGVIFMHKDSFSRGAIKTIRLGLKSLMGTIVSKNVINNGQRWIQYHFIIHNDNSSHFTDDKILQFNQYLSMNIKAWNVVVCNAISSQDLQISYDEALDIFPENYRNDFFAQQYIAQDAKNIDHLMRNSLEIVTDIATNDGSYIVKIFSKKDLFISDINNIINSIGLNIKYIHTFHFKDICDIHLYNINITGGSEVLQCIEKNQNQFTQSLSIILQNGSTCPINRLILNGMSARQIEIMSAIAAYTRQVTNLPIELINEAIFANPNISQMTITLFENKFSLTENSDYLGRESEILSEISKLKKSSHVKIMNCLMDVINAISRANIHQNINEKVKPYIAFKVHSTKISWLPKPVPYAEIFVYNNDFEGCHLRNKPVARGGFRWSDRIDYRTEVLGLIKAQIPKNSIIVPSGAKACFYIKKSAQDCHNYKDFVKECYKNFVRGILDLTDNIQNGIIFHPENTRIHDDKDPYIVAAADKGTATFSDIANGISAEYNFWLGDAFASGGSNGYSHKDMGITSRGAYVSAKQSFYELGIDVENSEISAVGVGDMSGDVFGNGMLLFKKLKLIAAFNHMHIFLDPNPNIQESAKERLRLFNNPELKWSDYNRDIVSAGGGIFERFGSKITVNSQIREALDIPSKIIEIEPEQLISYILQAKVDMLWNGGIGTLIKESSETNADVQDVFNDATRISGNQVCAKVVVEGGNVGVTQKARIECAKNGVKINMDSIDNSAGVDCSDHEVNIKIIFNNIGKFDAERNTVLSQMQDEVASLVLKNNYLQTKLLSVAQANVVRDMDFYAKIASRMSDAKILDINLENIPSQQGFLEMQKSGETLTRPHLCTLLSHAKIYLHDEIADIVALDDEIFNSDLLSYFPALIGKNYKEAAMSHPLRKNIIATSIANEIVNLCGITYLEKLFRALDIDPEKLVILYTVVREIFAIKNMFESIFAQDYVIPSQQQVGAISKLQDAIFFASLATFEAIDFSVSITQNIKNIACRVGEFPKILKGSCCSSTKTSCCFDADYTAKLKVLKSAFVIFETIKLSHVGKIPLENAYENISKIYGLIPLKKLRTALQNSISASDLDSAHFCFVKISNIVGRISSGENLDIQEIRNKITDIYNNMVSENGIVLDVNKCALILAKLSI